MRQFPAGNKTGEAHAIILPRAPAAELHLYRIAPWNGMHISTHFDILAVAQAFRLYDCMDNEYSNYYLSISPAYWPINYWLLL